MNVEITFAEEPILLFDLDEPKTKGEEKRVCLIISSNSPPSEVLPEHVRIRQSHSNDAWGVKSIQIQKYPGSAEYRTYSLDSNEKRFWTDGDSDCRSGTDGMSCCANGDWCELRMFDGN